MYLLRRVPVGKHILDAIWLGLMTEQSGLFDMLAVTLLPSSLQRGSIATITRHAERP